MAWLKDCAAGALFAFRFVYLYNIFPFYLLLVRFWSVDKPQDLWEAHCSWVSGIKLHKHQDSVEMGDGVMIASNHRNIADYFVHHCICRHTANTLSRAGLGMYFPLAYMITSLLGTVWYFRRGNTKSQFDK
jgi:hypothetical protein